jgi:predicted transcriptional regulator
MPEFADCSSLLRPAWLIERRASGARAVGIKTINPHDIMDAPTFTLLTQKLGIHRRNVGYSAAVALAEIAKSPAALEKRVKYGGNSPSAILQVMGPLIRNSLVELVRDGEQANYTITKQGQEWLELVKHHNLLP